MTSLYEIRYAPSVWRLLNGVFCIYKPNHKSVSSTRRTLLNNLCNDLNDMIVRPPRQMVQIAGDLSSGNELKVEIKENLSDNPLVVGKRYQQQDFALSVVNNPGYFASGVVVVFIGKMAKNANEFRRANHLRVYEIKGRLGMTTDNANSDGRIVEKSWFRHVNEGRISRVLSKIESTHQTLMYKVMGIDMTTQEAYDLASRGMVRPAMRKTIPILYRLRLTDLSLPEFTIEVECINEFDQYLFDLIQDIGFKLKSTAMCKQLRLKRYGPFTVDHSLLLKHWTCEHIIENIQLCKSMIKPECFQTLSPLLSSSSDQSVVTSVSDQQFFLDTLKQ